MSEYFTIEKEKDLNLIVTEIEPEEEKKYYSVHIEGLPYGSLIRETEDYSEALMLYRDIKKKFDFFKCRIVLQKHIIGKDNEEEVATIYSKVVGDDYEITKHLNDILEILNKLDRMKRMYLSTNSECDKYISAFNHSLENINAERLSEDQMRDLFRNVEEKGALRRISKSQVEHLTNLNSNLAQIRANVNKALESYKKIEYNRTTQKAIENRTAKDKEYLSTIGLL